MEKLWEELKKIEEEAANLYSEAKEESGKIIDLAKKYAEKLILNSRVNAEAEAEELLNRYLSEARKEGEEKIKENEERLKELRENAERRIKEAVEVIFESVVGRLQV